MLVTIRTVLRNTIAFYGLAIVAFFFGVTFRQVRVGNWSYCHSTRFYQFICNMKVCITIGITIKGNYINAGAVAITDVLTMVLEQIRRCGLDQRYSIAIPYNLLVTQCPKVKGQDHIGETNINDASHYRPIAITSALSKVYEKFF
jgi:hypothetical protein